MPFAPSVAQAPIPPPVPTAEPDDDADDLDRRLTLRQRDAFVARYGDDLSDSEGDGEALGGYGTRRKRRRRHFDEEEETLQPSMIANALPQFAHAIPTLPPPPARPKRSFFV